MTSIANQRDVEQVIAPKRETVTLLNTLSLKSKLVAGGFALGELRRSAAIVKFGAAMDKPLELKHHFQKRRQTNERNST